MTADDIRAMVTHAAREFGRYTFSDKGAGEVMNLSPILDHLKSLPAAEARELLVDVAGSPDELCWRLVQDLVSDLDDQPNEWWDILMEADVLSEMY